MHYAEMLRKSAREQKSIVCMGLDPVMEYLPELPGSIREKLAVFYKTVFTEMEQRGVTPGAFKPNIGYFSKLDKPLDGEFQGSLALADLINTMRKRFPGIPVILDAKRGDIATSSANYAAEAFDSWKSDAVTISPYMGSDSVGPFTARGKGVYILCRTSNPGAADLQNLVLSDNAGTGDRPLFTEVAGKIIEWAVNAPGTGAVVGATSPEELSQAAGKFAANDIPLLIPGVGSQGGSGSVVVSRLIEAGYDPLLARINSSSGITHPWKNSTAPENWAAVVVDNLEKLNRETGNGIAWN